METLSSIANGIKNSIPDFKITKKSIIDNTVKEMMLLKDELNTIIELIDYKETDKLKQETEEESKQETEEEPKQETEEESKKETEEESKKETEEGIKLNMEDINEEDIFVNLPNNNNSCFINVALQILLNNKEFCDFIIKYKDKIDNELINKLREIIIYINENKKNIDHIKEEFNKKIGELWKIIPELKCGKQSDSNEFLTKILENFDNFLISKSISNNFYKFDIEHNENKSKDNINILSLPICKEKDNCYNDFNECISNYNITFENNPNNLLITLLRYDNSNNKINNEVAMDTEININNKYILQGFIHHEGTTENGHYIYYRYYNGKWYEINDTLFPKITEITDIKEKKNTGYIYYYKKFVDSSLLNTAATAIGTGATAIGTGATAIGTGVIETGATAASAIGTGAAAIGTGAMETGATAASAIGTGAAAIGTGAANAVNILGNNLLSVVTPSTTPETSLQQTSTLNRQIGGLWLRNNTENLLKLIKQNKIFDMEEFNKYKNDFIEENKISDDTDLNNILTKLFGLIKKNDIIEYDDINIQYLNEYINSDKNIDEIKKIDEIPFYIKLLQPTPETTTPKTTTPKTTTPKTTTPETTTPETTTPETTTPETTTPKPEIPQEDKFNGLLLSKKINTSLYLENRLKGLDKKLASKDELKKFFNNKYKFKFLIEILNENTKIKENTNIEGLIKKIKTNTEFIDQRNEIYDIIIKELQEWYNNHIKKYKVGENIKDEDIKDEDAKDYKDKQEIGKLLEIINLKTNIIDTIPPPTVKYEPLSNSSIIPQSKSDTIPLPTVATTNKELLTPLAIRKQQIETQRGGYDNENSEEPETTLDKIIEKISEMNKNIKEIQDIDYEIRKLKIKQEISKPELEEKLKDLKNKKNELINNKEEAYNEIKKLIDSIEILTIKINKEIEINKDNGLISQLKKYVTGNENNKTIKNQSKRLKSQKEFRITSKVYPLPYVNSKGYRIGNYELTVDSDKLPFSAEDQANHYLYNLLDYVKNESSMDISLKKTKKKEKTVRDFFKNKGNKFTTFTPIIYPNPEKEKFLKEEKKHLKEENREIRENLKKIREELLDFGNTKDENLHQRLKDDIIKEFDKINNDKELDDIEKQKKIQKTISEYLDIIDEIENDDKYINSDIDVGDEEYEEEEENKKKENVVDRFNDDIDEVANFPETAQPLKHQEKLPQQGGKKKSKRKTKSKSTTKSKSMTKSKR